MIPEACEDCRYLNPGDGCWPDECERECRSLDDYDERPDWCTLEDD